MATFRVGQRVRIVNAIAEHRWAIGREATVTGPLDWFGEHPLKIDGELEEWTAAPACLAPIQPEGWKVVDWSSCLWMPEHMRETA